MFINILIILILIMIILKCNYINKHINRIIIINIKF